jgi:hypothetical protein
MDEWMNGRMEEWIDLPLAPWERGNEGVRSVQPSNHPTLRSILRSELFVYADVFSYI